MNEAMKHQTTEKLIHVHVVQTGINVLPVVSKWIKSGGETKSSNMKEKNKARNRS